MSSREVILVVQQGDHSLESYDFETGAELDRVPLDPFPHEFAISPDGRLAYMAHFGVALAEHEGPGGNTVSVVDIQARRWCLPGEGESMTPGQPRTRLTARTSWRDPGGYARRAVLCVALVIFVGAHGGGPSLEAGMEAIRTGVSLTGADLRGADLRGADLREASLQEAQLQGARLQGARLQGADLQGANLERAQLQGVSLQGANLQEANLEEANLQGAFLWQANLQGAQLQGADLTGAVGLTLWQVETAVTDERTRLPDYLRPPPANSKAQE